MTAKIHHFALFQSALLSVGFVMFPWDELDSEALNMFKYNAFFNIVNHMIELL